MGHLDFALWMVLWPISTELIEYINAKRKVIEGKPHASSDLDVKFGVFTIIVWVIVGFLILAI